MLINKYFLKKIKYSDNSNQKYQYGIRLINKNYKTEVFMENDKSFQK